MTLQDYLSLKNGSDIRGVASDLVASEPVNLTNETAEQIAKAFCVWLSERRGGAPLQIAVGYDSRISSQTLCESVAQGIIRLGHNAVVTGLSTTPSMFMLLKDKRRNVVRVYDGAIMITASHLPANRNGLKFFDPDGGLESKDVQEILELAATRVFNETAIGKRSDQPYLDEYAAMLVKTVRDACQEELPLRGKKIVVDAGNGAGGFFTDKVLIPLGADTKGSQFLEPNGLFPNHIPNPENKEAMRSVCEAVKRADADFGIIFDTDVDRAAAVDKGGKEINRNRLIALVAALLLKERPGTIVTDSVTSKGLTEFIAKKGGKHHRFKRGYKNVINEAIRLNAIGEYTPLAIETSGHAALIDNYFLDDGAYLMTRLLIALAKATKEGKTISDYLADLPMPAEEREIRLKFRKGCDFKALGNALLRDYETYTKTQAYITPDANNYEGWRATYDEGHGNGWALLRMSLHEPILPVNIESDDLGGTIRILQDLYAFLQGYDFLDLTPIQTILTENGVDPKNISKAQ